MKLLSQKKLRQFNQLLNIEEESKEILENNELLSDKIDDLELQCETLTRK